MVWEIHELMFCILRDVQGELGRRRSVTYVCIFLVPYLPDSLAQAGNVS